MATDSKRPPAARVLRERARYLYRFGLVPRALTLLPLPWAYRAGSALGRFRYRRQRRALDLQAAEMRARLRARPEEVDRWLRRCFELAVCEDLDWPLFGRMADRGVASMVEIVGREHLDEALAHGRGALIYSGHFFGHFTAAVALATLGYPVSIAGLFRDTFNPAADDWYPQRRHRLLERLGCRMLKMHEEGIGATRGAIGALSANEVVMILIDHTPNRHTVPAQFLGTQGFFPSGPAWLARRSGAPLVFFHLRRPERTTPMVLEFEPPSWVTGDVEAAVRQMAGALERAVLADPPSWGPWLYPRKFIWSRPSA